MELNPVILFAEESLWAMSPLTHLLYFVFEPLRIWINAPYLIFMPLVDDAKSRNTNNWNKLLHQCLSATCIMYSLLTWKISELCLNLGLLTGRRVACSDSVVFVQSNFGLSLLPGWWPCGSTANPNSELRNGLHEKRTTMSLISMTWHECYCKYEMNSTNIRNTAIIHDY